MARYFYESIRVHNRRVGLAGRKLFKPRQKLGAIHKYHDLPALGITTQDYFFIIPDKQSVILAEFNFGQQGIALIIPQFQA
ncbi:MAG: hypothetical protein PHO81_03900, partial [Candidatus Omnitrophica bacterium]|nr:hypothetical protein [Candidatus Omnitrophota bacterium]